MQNVDSDNTVKQPAQPPKTLQSALRTPPRSPLPSAMSTSRMQASPSQLPRPAAVGSGNRTVSFDPAKVREIKSLARPRTSSIDSFGTTSSSGGGGGGVASKQLFNLNDVLRGTPELEAETNLLRAVEKITGQAHQRTNTETARLFNTIAADELTSAHLTAPSVSEHGTGTPNRSRANTASSATGTAAAGAPPAPGGGKAKFRSIVKKLQEKENERSVEQTLFGLSNALTELNKANKSRKNSDTNILEEKEVATTPLNATDKLLQTVTNSINKPKAAEGENNGDDVELGGNKNNNSPPTNVVANTTEDDSASDHSETDPSNGVSGTNKKRKRRNKGAQLLTTASDGIRADWELFNEFLGGNKATIKSYARTVIVFVMIPSLLLSSLLFHFVEEPNTDENGNVIPGQQATPSWWILYFGVRQVVTLTMALVTQALFIDYLALGSRLSLQWFGPIITLLVVQSKGWPFISIFWGIYNLILLSGNSRYVRHWGYWQGWYGLFNEDNPGGHVIDNQWNYTVLRLMVIIGVVVSIKRLFTGLVLGRRTFAHFGQELAAVMKNMVLVGEVATLSREIETDRRAYLGKSLSMAPSLTSTLSGGWAPDTINDFVEQETDAAQAAEEDEARIVAAKTNAAVAAKTFVQKQKTPAPPPPPSSPDTPVQEAAEGKDDNGANEGPQEDFTASEQVAISELLDSWEEPARAEEEEQRRITIGAVMQFRQALTFMKKKYPFLPAFGPADTRERCIESAQQVYNRLLMRTPDSQHLPFETLALLAKDDKGGIDERKAKELIKIFRPERDGTLAKLDFVKSIDVIYKQLRLLSANISNSSQIDKAVESLVNIVFYVIVGCYVLWEMGEDPLTLFFSFSSVILGFAFMFGASASKFFDGVLFILVQRPYGVGDRIHLSNPQNETSNEGSSCWIVEKVTLSTTTVYWGATNERATISNGAISNLRVINGARSPNSTIFVPLKFGIDTPYEKIAIFKTAVEQFLKDRPREWLTFVGFRPTEVAVDLGYIGYKVIAQHRVGWQLVGQVITSKAELTTYCLEVAKQLEMRYTSPPLPVNLKLNGSAAGALQALGGQGNNYKLDKKKIDEALSATSSHSMKHQAFQEGDE